MERIGRIFITSRMALAAVALCLSAPASVAALDPEAEPAPTTEPPRTYEGAVAEPVQPNTGGLIAAIRWPEPRSPFDGLRANGLLQVRSW